tara:strand:- start:625 stop:1338 length:714 start_codon:yes stop_codon:yes gene_type:complete
MKKRNCIAIIPARFGSKRIKRKNIKNFFGRPIISYAIQNAINSKLFDDVIVSTDDIKIKKIAIKFGASVPFLRPKKISGDFTGIVEVVSHALKTRFQNYRNIFGVCCIFPTTPLLRRIDLIRSFDIFKKGKWDYVFCAKKYEHPIQRSFTLNRNKGLKLLSSNLNKISKTQDFPVSYHDVGQFYWAKPETWIKKKFFFSHRSTVYLLPESRIQDIDTLQDWKRVEEIYVQQNTLKKK